MIVHPVIIDADRDLRLNHGFEAEYCPFRFRGHYYDTDTGLYYIDKKYYDSTNSLFVTPCNFRELWYNVGEVFGGVNRYALPGGSPDSLGIYAPGPLATLELTPTEKSSVKISWWIKVLSWFGGLSNKTKWVVGAVTFAVAVVLTALTGGALLPLFVKMAMSIGISAALGGVFAIINQDNVVDGFVDGAADGAMWGGISVLFGAFVGAAKYCKRGSLGAEPGSTEMVTIKKGQTFDRYGGTKGYFITDTGTPPERLALPSNNTMVKTSLKATRSFRVYSGIVKPANGGPGGGVQYVMRYPLDMLIGRVFEII